jgi:hypothetical protein
MPYTGSCAMIVVVVLRANYRMSYFIFDAIRCSAADSFFVMRLESSDRLQGLCLKIDKLSFILSNVLRHRQYKRIPRGTL